MNIFVDADACPKAIKEILYRAAMRAHIPTTFVANHWLDLPPSDFITMKKVGSGCDVADHAIIGLMSPGDLVVTADIPLAYDAVQKGGLSLNPRGQLYSENNVEAVLASRDWMAHLRDAGTITGGPSPLSKRDCQDFANQLDCWITQNK